MNDYDDGFIEKRTGTYLKIGTQGDILETVRNDDPPAEEMDSFKQENPKAVRREWKLPNGDSGVKWENHYAAIRGTINFITVRDTKFGTTQLNLGLQTKNRSVVITTNTNSMFGDSILQAVPNIDRTKEIEIEPVAYTNKKGKKVAFVRLTQENKVLASAFSRYNEDTKKYEAHNGYPEPDFDRSKATRERWINYFATARLFVQDYLVDNGLLDTDSEAPVAEEPIETAEDNTIEASAIPF